ncbi:MAG TPA: DNA topoisomerase IB, partial [Bauldia sp.]|nr:DNA topoisomerase IB [Bauldia sp.]
VGSADVNRWLRAVSGRDITAKDFRTWAGTVLAALALQELGSAHSMTTGKANVRDAIERVARRLGNTATICRKCYVHPAIVSSYLEGTLALRIEPPADTGRPDKLSQLRHEEVAVLSFLKRSLRRDRRRQRAPPRPATMPKLARAA